jgi:hypothetical protein
VAGTTITTATIAISAATTPVPMFPAACAVAGGGATAASGDDHHDAHCNDNNAADDNDGPRTASPGRL